VKQRRNPNRGAVKSEAEWCGIANKLLVYCVLTLALARSLARSLSLSLSLLPIEVAGLRQSVLFLWLCPADHRPAQQIPKETSSRSRRHSLRIRIHTAHRSLKASFGQQQQMAAIFILTPARRHPLSPPAARQESQRFLRSPAPA